MRYTMDVNAQGRQLLLNAGGIVESHFFTAARSMEVSASVYQNWWRFDMESLPADLIQRGMAVQDATEPHGLKLLIEDYPYATDGLLILSAIEQLVQAYGDSVDSYTCFHIIGDLVELINVVDPDEGKVFVVGHDWGAILGWYLCMFRPDKVKALVNLSVPFLRFHREIKPVDFWISYYGSDHYMSRFQEYGEIEGEFAEIGVERVVKEYLSDFPVLLPKGKLFKRPLDEAITLPFWLSEEEASYYVTKFQKTGFTGPLNFYRNLNRNWELLKPWVGSKIKTPAKFIMGDKDLVYGVPGMKDYIHNGGFQEDVPSLQQVVVMEGVGHFINMEKPDEINQYIYDFFTQFH